MQHVFVSVSFSLFLSATVYILEKLSKFHQILYYQSSFHKINGVGMSGHLTVIEIGGRRSRGLELYSTLSLQNTMSFGPHH
jgi:hypothetical protein